MRRANQQRSVFIQEFVGKGLKRCQLMRTRIDISMQRPVLADQNDVAPVGTLAEDKSARGSLGNIVASAQSLERHETVAFFAATKNVLRSAAVETRKRTYSLRVAVFKSANRPAVSS